MPALAASRPVSAAASSPGSAESRRCGSSSSGHARRETDFELTEENADAVAELCVRLDGLAARARACGRADQAALSARDPRASRRQARPPEGGAGRGLPERHRTLRAAIEWSYDLLTADEQALFTSLGVFVGGFTLDGAEAVAGDLDARRRRRGRVAPRTTTCSGPSRMAGGEPRFGMLETIREYALERLAERGDGEAVRRRHAGFYLRARGGGRAALLGPQQLRWLERLDAERDNIRAALTWAAESGEVGDRLADRRRALALLADARVPDGRARAPRAARSPWARARSGARAGPVAGRLDRNHPG